MPCSESGSGPPSAPNARETRTNLQSTGLDNYSIDDLQEVKGQGTRFTEQTPRVVGTRSAVVASGWSRPGQLLPRAGARKEGQDVADGGFLAGGFG